MKKFIVVSIAITTFALMGQGKAEEINVPAWSSDLAACMEWANALPGPMVAAGQARCKGIDNCINNYSEDAQSLNDCIGPIEAAFNAGESPSGVSFNTPTSAVSTDSDNSRYETNPSEGGKGWENAEQAP